jgi:ribonuclease HI/uncharacterized phage-like protein YoqJ
MGPARVPDSPVVSPAVPRTETDSTVVYTDGACSGNPGPGGWAWIVPDGPFASGAKAHTTNQAMEICAALEAVRTLDGPLEIRSDSTYVVNCFRDRWWEGWLARGWLNSQRKPVANRDLWEPLVEEVRRRPGIRFTWVKGHGADPWNDKADRLAVEAAQRQTGRRGDGPPEQLGPADVTGGPAGTVGEPAATVTVPGAGYQEGIAGHSLAVLGHQPPELGGYDPNPLADAVTMRLRAILAAKAELHPDLVVVSGLRLGAEQLGAEAAVAEGVPYVVVLPFPDADARWPAARRARFAELVAGARDVLTLEKKVPTTTAKVAAALTRRDAWLARTVDEAVLVWDGEDQRLGRLSRTLEERLGDDVWFLNPKELA